MTILLADIAVFPSRSDFFFPTPFLVENICLLLKFLRCSRGRLCRWMLSSQPLSMRSNRSLSMCGARQDISTVLPFGWNQLLDSDFRGRPCTPRTGTGTFTTTILPPRQMVRQKYQKHQNISLITRLPGAPDNSIEKGDSRELLEQ